MNNWMDTNRYLTPDFLRCKKYRPYSSVGRLLVTLEKSRCNGTNISMQRHLWKIPSLQTLLVSCYRKPKTNWLRQRGNLLSHVCAYSRGRAELICCRGLLADVMLTLPQLQRWICDSGLRLIHSEHFPDDSELFRNGHESQVRIVRAKETQLPGCLCEIKKQTSLFLK